MKRPRSLTKIIVAYLPLFILILLGSLFLSLTTIRSGSLSPHGLSFWGPNGHDAIWHLAIIRQITIHFPPNQPTFSGYKLSNYHWGFDFIAAAISIITRINIFDIYFRIIPLVVAFSIGVLSYLLAIKISKNHSVAFWFVFLNYFAGSYGWIFTLIKDKTIGGESLFWSMQSISALLNPPYALSLVILLISLILFYKYLQKPTLLLSIITGLSFASLSGIKIYAGIIVGLSYSIFLLYRLIIKKINYYDYVIWFITALFSLLLLYLLGALGSQGLLEFHPFWFIHSLIESSDRLYLPRIASLRFNLAHQLISYKLPFFISLEFLLFLIFLIGNMGSRIFGMFSIYNSFLHKKNSSFDMFLYSFLIISVSIPTFFIQKGTAWNTIQFLYYFLFISNYFFALFISHLFESRKLITTLLIVLIILLTLPTNFSTLKDYFGNPAPAAISNTELKALRFLSIQKPGTVLTYPYDNYKKMGVNTPLPLYIYETTSYVSAMTGHITFLEDEMNLDITGYNWKPRRQVEEQFFKSKDKYFSRGVLINNNIEYIYLVGDQILPLSENELQINQIFNNNLVKIYRVQR